VQKFGGTSVANADRIRAVAGRVVATAEQGHHVVVVVSAMGDTTDDLIGLARQLVDDPLRYPREYDMLVSAGERVAMSLLAMAICDHGREAVSFTGSQAGILTDTLHGKARIVGVEGRRIVEALDQGRIPVVAGFQGVSPETRDVTTFGRGASDLTAVALAASLGADLCELYKDVQGVSTADPKFVRDARKLHAVSYEEMLEMSATGAGILMARSVELARNHRVVLHVRSSFDDEEGTYVTEEDERMMEKAIISAVTYDTSEAKVTVVAVPDRPGIAASIFRPLADKAVNVDMIEQNVSHDGRTDVSFTCPRTELREAMVTVEQVATRIGASTVTSDDGVGRVSLIGAGMRTHPGVAADMFEALADAEVNIEMISTSPIRISCVVREAHVERAVRAIHERFRLSEEVVYRAGHPDGHPA
jgi:aspartate kinase